MNFRFQSDKGLQSHYNTKHDWHLSHANEQQSKIETRARETGYPRYALPAAEVVIIAASSSSMSSPETEPNFERLEANVDKEALEEPREHGRNNSYDENDSKDFNEIKLISMLQKCQLCIFLMQQAVLVPLET